METALRHAVRLTRRAMAGGDSDTNRPAHTGLNHQTTRRPTDWPICSWWLEHHRNTGTGKAIAVGFSGLDINSFHTVEVLQWFVERRIGEETEVAAETYSESGVVWQAVEKWHAAHRRLTRPLAFNVVELSFMKLALVILAAGSGRRYGSLKQLAPIGPDGSTLMEYSLYDAMRAGFDKVVFVVRQETRNLIQAHADQRFGRHIDTRFAVQRMDVDGADPTIVERRTKPWGTGQAVLAAAEFIDEPFAVINADDFLGTNAFNALGAFLNETTRVDPATYAMVGYKLRNTLSEHGAVSRGVCQCTPDGWLTQIAETHKIVRGGDGAVGVGESGTEERLSDDEIVSMNLWGFSTTVFDNLEKNFHLFLQKTPCPQEDEFYLPAAIQQAVEKRHVQVKVLPSTDKWCGVTYAEDTPHVVRRIGELVNHANYPETLWI